MTRWHRPIRYFDAESGLSLVFLTNAFHLPALTIAAIYRRRWQIELFFRWIKQHLRLRGFFGNDPNGVRVQVWTAICAYLLVAIAKKENALPQSLHQVLQVVSLSCLEKVPLVELFATHDTTNEPFDIPIQLEINGF
jgi:IS4 transposase